MGISDEIKVAIMAVNETTVLKVKAIIINCHFHESGDDGKEIGQKACWTFRDFALLLKPVLLLF